MLEMGFTRDDLYRLEKLSSAVILDRIPEEGKPLKHNRREDVILYMDTWADLLEEKLLDEIELPNFEIKRRETLTADTQRHKEKIIVYKDFQSLISIK